MGRLKWDQRKDDHVVGEREVWGGGRDLLITE